MNSGTTVHTAMYNSKMSMNKNQVNGSIGTASGKIVRRKSRGTSKVHLSGVKVSQVRTRPTITERLLTT